jgi:hypothetical protein
MVAFPGEDLWIEDGAKGCYVPILDRSLAVPPRRDPTVKVLSSKGRIVGVLLLKDLFIEICKAIKACQA